MPFKQDPHCLNVKIIQYIFLVELLAWRRWYPSNIKLTSNIYRIDNWSQ